MCATISQVHWCYKCQNKLLIEKVKRLEEQLGYILQLSSDDLILSPLEIHNAKRNFNFSDKYIPINPYTPDTLKYYHFFTITFDPAKFGVGNQPKDEEHYILKCLYDCRGYFTELTGCFELTKTGTTHAHFITYSYQPRDFHKALKKMFTDNPRNNVAIHSGPAKFPAAEEYISKDDGMKFQWCDMSNVKNTLDFI